MKFAPCNPIKFEYKRNKILLYHHVGKDYHYMKAPYCICLLCIQLINSIAT